MLIYERLREELAAGKPLRSALDAAYEKAFSAIFDSNLTTLITALILFWKATGPVKGFADTHHRDRGLHVFCAPGDTNCFKWAIDSGAVRSLRACRA